LRTSARAVLAGLAVLALAGATGCSAAPGSTAAPTAAHALAAPVAAHAGSGPGPALDRLPAADGHPTGFVLTGFTSSRGSGPLQDSPAAARTPAALELQVGAATTRGAWQGVGAAFTDSTVTLLQNATPEAAETAMELLFDPVEGAGLTQLLLPQTSTDFSSTTWTAAAPGPEAALAQRWALEAERLRADLEVGLSSWSPPASMKRTRSLSGGGVTEEAVAQWPQVLADRAKQLTDAGLRVSSISVQNEPGWNDPTYPTAAWTLSQQIRGAQHLATALTARFGSAAPTVRVHENNVKDAKDAATVAAAVPGSEVGFHCYDGEGAELVAAIDGLPAGTPVALDECTGLVSRGHWVWEDFSWAMDDWLLPGIGAGATEARMWNAVLDPNGAMHSGGCPNCRGLLTMSAAGDAVYPAPELWALAHFGRVFVPGSTLHPAALPGQPDVLAVVADGADGTRSVVVSNSSDHDIELVLPGTDRQVTVPAEGAGSWRWLV
jgi:glucosylceramidase